MQHANCHFPMTALGEVPTVRHPTDEMSGTVLSERPVSACADVSASSPIFVPHEATACRSVLDPPSRQ